MALTSYEKLIIDEIAKTLERRGFTTCIKEIDQTSLHYLHVTKCNIWPWVAVVAIHHKKQHVRITASQFNKIRPGEFDLALNDPRLFENVRATVLRIYRSAKRYHGKNGQPREYDGLFKPIASASNKNITVKCGISSIVPPSK